MYILTFVILFLISSFTIYKKYYKEYFLLYGVVFIWMCFHDGFRWETGTDWLPYFVYFRDCLILGTNYYDFGYGLVNIAIRFLTSSYSVFLIINAVVFYALFLISFKRFSCYPFFSLFIFYGLTLNYMGANRQLLAVCICYFSLYYFFKREHLKFLILIIIAALFHKTAIIFFSCYLLKNPFSNRTYIFLILISIIISISGIISHLPLNIFLLFENSISSKLLGYYKVQYGLKDVNIALTVLALCRKLFFLILALLYKRFLIQKSSYFILFFNLYFISNIIYIIFNNTPLQIMVSRLNLYFNISEVFLVPLIFLLFKENMSRVIFYSLIVLYTGTLLIKAINNYNLPGHDNILYPYKGIIINSEFDRKMW